MEKERCGQLSLLERPPSLERIEVITAGLLFLHQGDDLNGAVALLVLKCRYRECRLCLGHGKVLLFLSLECLEFPSTSKITLSYMVVSMSCNKTL
jgi:hypothetical protein